LRLKKEEQKPPCHEYLASKYSKNRNKGRIFVDIVTIISVTAQIVWIILLIVGIVTLGKIRRKWSFDIFLICIIILSYWILIRDRITIIRNKYNPLLRTNQAYSNFMINYHRYPMSMEEIKKDTIASRWFDDDYVKNIYEHDPDEPHWALRPFLLKVPDYGVTVWLEDTLIYSVLYIDGFDYDDDSLKKEYNFDYHWRSPNNWDYIRYILLPLPWDGDIYIEGYVRSIYDPWFDTTFVRQILEIYGDTLSPDEYQEWLRKRAEYSTFP
jgi:hypothetical protein